MHTPPFRWARRQPKDATTLADRNENRAAQRHRICCGSYRDDAPGSTSLSDLVVRGTSGSSGLRVVEVVDEGVDTSSGIAARGWLPVDRDRKDCGTTAARTPPHCSSNASP